MVKVSQSYSQTLTASIPSEPQCTNIGCRELAEESGVRASSLRQIGLLMFEFIGDPQLLEVHVYSTDEFGGVIVESEGTDFVLSFCVSLW